MENAQNTDIDTRLRERIVAALQDNARTAGAPIQVVSQQGTVTLEGTVESDEVRQAAVEIASEQPEAVQVVDDLAVTGKKEKDEWIEAPEAAVFDSRAPYIPDLSK